MYKQLFLPDLQVMLDESDVDSMKELCQIFHPAVTAEILAELSPEAVWRVLSCSDVSRQAEIFEFIPITQQVALVDVIGRKPLSALIEEMSADDRVDLLSRLDQDHIDSILPLMAQAERSDIRKLLSYPDDSAGSIMTTEYASLPGDITVAEALQRLRQQAPNRETIYYIFILDEGRRLQGVVSLRDLILAKPSTLVSAITNREAISVRVDDDQEFVANELARYDFIAIPVVDDQNRLVGIVTHDDVLDVLREEATGDTYRLAAVEPLEDSYMSTPLRTITWKRGIWLVVLLGAAFLTAGVISYFEPVSMRYPWMVLFIPLVLASGGNAGSQSATLVIRAIAVDKMSSTDHLKMSRREMWVALILASSLMLLGFLSAACFVSVSEASVVASTVFLVVVFGTVTGSLLPLALRKLGMDPALMSNPLIAAQMDMLGVVTYFSIAAWLLG